MSIFRSSDDVITPSDRSAGDRSRHRAKVRKAIKENVGNIISEEAIIGQSGDKKIKVPIKGIKEYRFIYGSNNPGTAQGTGDERSGDVIGGQEDQPGSGQPGSAPGEDIYETEITLEELMEILFEDLALPDLEKKKLRYLEAERLLKRKGYRTEGIRVRLSKKRSVTRKIRRKKMARRLQEELQKQEKVEKEDYKPEDQNELETPPSLSLPKREEIQREGVPERFPFHKDDLRYGRVAPEIKRHSNAVVFCIMDTSGSMDMLKKYLARSFYFLLYRFLKSKYQNVEVVFIAHHTEAKEVTEEEFFHKGESGGTKISSGYKKALEIIEKRYHPDRWNIYAFHCSDGDNFDEDNEAAIKYAQDLTDVCNLFGYGEIKPQGSYSWSSMLLILANNIQGDNFATVKIHEKSEVFPAFKALLAKERVKED